MFAVKDQLRPQSVADEECFYFDDGNDSLSTQQWIQWVSFHDSIICSYWLHLDLKVFELLKNN